MACNIQNEAVKAQRDIFKAIKESAKFKKAESKLNEILTNGINVNELMAQQKATGKKNLITRIVRDTKTDVVSLPLNYIDVVEVKVKKEGTNFFFRLSESQFSVERRRIGTERAGSDEAAVITKKRYKEIKVKYTIEDTAEKRDMQEDAAKLQKLANAITSGDDQGALKLFEDEVKKVTEAFDGVYSGIHQIVDKIRTDAKIPLPTADAVVIVDKEKRHTGSNVINLEDPISITRVRARKANTNFFFNVTQYKFLKEGASIIATNSYEEYIVNYRAKGSATAGNLTGKLPSKDSIVADINSAISQANQQIGNVAEQINNAAGQFGKDISGLISAGSSGSLLNNALASAQNNPSPYTVEKTVRGSNTNAIVLEGLSGGQDGIVEVMTRREDQSFFSAMQQGNIAGYRLDGEELFIFEPRAQVKCTYKQEVDPPASTGIPSISNDPDIPKLDPCKDIPAISVKIQEEIRKDQATGQTEVITIKNKEGKPPTRKMPIIKPEPEVSIAETPTVVAAEEAPTTTDIRGLEIPRNEAMIGALKVYNEEQSKSKLNWQEKSDGFVKKLNDSFKDPEFLAFKAARKKAEKKIPLQTFIDMAGDPDGPTVAQAEAAAYTIQCFVGYKNFSSHFTSYKAAVAASSFEQSGIMTTEKYEKLRDDFFNFEGIVPADDKSNKTGADLKSKITTEIDRLVFESVRRIHTRNRKILRTAAVYQGKLDISELNA